MLVENAIGKSKHWLKASDLPVPISAYDAFASLQQHGVIDLAALRQWNAAIGLRNRIVPDYMNVDMEFVGNLILNKKHHFIADFLERPIAAIRRVGDGGSRTIE